MIGPSSRPMKIPTTKDLMSQSQPRNCCVKRLSLAKQRGSTQGSGTHASLASEISTPASPPDAAEAVMGRMRFGLDPRCCTCLKVNARSYIYIYIQHIYGSIDRYMDMLMDIWEIKMHPPKIIIVLGRCMALPNKQSTPNSNNLPWFFP